MIGLFLSILYLIINSLIKAAKANYAINAYLPEDIKDISKFVSIKQCKNNEIDLNKAINEKIVFGAGLDVFEKEPVNINNPLLKNKKVLLSPHSATFTNECKSRMSLETTKNIIDFFENKIDKSMIVKI